MLLRFRFSNYRSFREEQELSLVASPLSENPEAVMASSAIPDGVLPVAAIYGANASGKSNVLKALQYMLLAIKDSFGNWPPNGPIPYEPYALDGSSSTQPSQFVIDFLFEGSRYHYGFTSNSDGIVSEWLHAFPNQRRQVWFDRKRGRPISFSRTLIGENTQIAKLTRPNSLFLAAAAQANHRVLAPLHQWLTSGQPVVGPARETSLHDAMELLERSQTVLLAVGRLLMAADLGISRLTIKPSKPSLSEPSEPAASASVAALRARIFKLRRELEFHHSGSAGSLIFSRDQESDGTLAYLSILASALTRLGAGGLLLVDELDRSLHPILARSLVELFNSKESNPKGAQLIFNTHDTNLLSGGLLRRDQIWFTEKDRKGASHLYPLTDFKPRKGENLENGYLQGRYGAIPFLNSEAFFNAAVPSVGNGSKKHGKAKKRQPPAEAHVASHCRDSLSFPKVRSLRRSMSHSSATPSGFPSI